MFAAAVAAVVFGVASAAVGVGSLQPARRLPPAASPGLGAARPVPGTVAPAPRAGPERELEAKWPWAV